MSPDAPISAGGEGVWSRIELRLDRIEDKLDVRMTALDNKVETQGRAAADADKLMASRLDRLEGRLEGSLSIVKWLGPVGLAALIFGLLTLYGLLPGPVL